MHLFPRLPSPPPSRIDPSFSVPKANSSHPLLCENLSVRFLPIHHTTHYAPHLDIHQTSHVPLHNPSRSALVPPLADDLCHLTMPKDVCFLSRLEGTPRLLQILMAEFRQEPFFFFSHPKAKTQARGQRGLASVAKEESTDRAKPLVLIGLCKQADLLSLTGLRAEEPGQIALSQSDKKQGSMSERLYRARNNTLIQSQD